jgi:hypothetical protein
MPRLALPTVTLCAVDTRSPGLALQSLRRSMAQVDFAQVLLFTHAQAAQDASAGAGTAGVQHLAIDVLRSGEDYSRFVLRVLPGYITTPFVLVTQWDGFVTDAAAWRDEFLDWDYIGAPWPDAPPGQSVGNGGFSLRSKRCLQAGLDPQLSVLHPEDQALCRSYRPWLEQHHGLRFAPDEVARRFAFENQAVSAPTFGFHGPYNLPRVLDEATLYNWLMELPSEFFRSRDARRMARALLARRMPHAAAALLQRRQAAGRTDPNTRLLGVAASLMRRFGHPAPKSA